MKRILIFLALLLFGIMGKSQTTNWAVSFADAILARYPSTINSMTGKGWEYSNSIVLHGIEKVYYATGDDKYLNYIKRYVDTYVNSNGDIAFDPSANNLDHLHPGLLCLFLYRETGQEKYKLAADNIRAEFDNQPRNPSGGFWHKQRYPNQMWADGIYMAEPFLVKYGSMFNETEYCNNEATVQTLLLAEHAYDSVTKLLYHGWDETKNASWADPVSGISPVIWSRGLGWYCMALVDILNYLPEEHDNYNHIIELLNHIADGLKNAQDSTSGLWYQVVDKGKETDNWHELSGSGMFVYAIKKAVDAGYIDSSYSNVAQKGWQGIQDYITLDGQDRPVISGYVGGMGIMDSYQSYVEKTTETCPPSRHPHGYCAILNAAAVMEEIGELERYSFSLNPADNGQIISDLPQGSYVKGRDIELEAVPDEGYSFDKWIPEILGTNPTMSFQLDSNISISAHFSEITSTHKINSHNEFSVIPNPFHDKLNIITTDQELSIQIYDIKGHLWLDEKVQPTGDWYEVERAQKLPSGIYLIKIKSNSGMSIHKIIKN